MNRQDDAQARVTLSLLGEAGDADLGELVATLGAVEAVRALANKQRPTEFSPQRFAAALARFAPRTGVYNGHDQFERARRADAHLLIPTDPHWPAPLHDLGTHMPLLLWVRGDPTIVSKPSAAIVGARAATGYGEHVAGEFSAALARTGAMIVSGGAYGIDGVAHRAALAVDGQTTAVMAGGVDRPYPAGHASMLAQVARSGAVISEVPLGVTPSRWRFLARNRIIAALADVTVVVEAGWRSGSLNTAGHAAALGRPLGAVPGPITSPASMGCHRLLREYDAVCVTTPDEVRELAHAQWGTLSPSPQRPAGATAGDASDDRVGEMARVADALSKRVSREVDDIARLSGLSRADVQAALGHLVLAGIVERTADGYRLAPAD